LGWATWAGKSVLKFPNPARQRIRQDILQEKQAEYGREIVPTLSAQLTPEFGDGFSKRNLFRMVQFAEAFPNERIVATLSRELGWSHFVELLPLKRACKSPKTGGQRFLKRGHGRLVDGCGDLQRTVASTMGADAVIVEILPKTSFWGPVVQGKGKAIRWK
jgi:hypothetical protein